MKANVNCPCCHEPLVIDVENMSVVHEEVLSVENNLPHVLNELGIEFG